MNDPSNVGFWSARYGRGEDTWDKGRATPPLVRLAAEGHVAPGARLCVPGAGRGHDAFHFARQGCVVTAVDFAPEAAAAMRERALELRIELEVLERDVFTLGHDLEGRFDAVLEHTALCAVDPSRSAEYARMVATLLRQGGVYLGLFFAHGREGGPPYHIGEPEARRLFAGAFAIERLHEAPDSLPERAGLELEFVMRRREAT